MKEKIRALYRRVAEKVTPLFARLKIKKKARDPDKPLPKFRFHRNFWILVALIPFALLFTQALISSVSAVIFVFIILLPLISLGYMFLGVAFIKLYLDSSTTEIEKMKPVSFSLALSNESPFPFPFVEAVITVPGDNAIRSDSQLTMLSLIPFGSYVINKTVTFKYRGAYDIGVSDLYIYDFFHFFSYRVEINLFRQIFVLPRQLMMPGSAAGDTSAENTEHVARRAGSDITETSDIRSYVSGDSLRSIHWKLSSKTQELMVRQYSQNSETQTFIFCDTASRFEPNEKRFENDINEFAVDGVVEAAIAIVKHNLQRANNSITLAWFDSRCTGDIVAIKLSGLHEFEQSYHFFATAPVTRTELDLLDLFASVAPSDAQNSSIICIGGAPDKLFSSAVSSIAAAASGDVDAFVFTPADKVIESAKKDYFAECEGCLNELSRLGVTIHSAHFEQADIPSDQDEEKEGEDE